MLASERHTESFITHGVVDVFVKGEFLRFWSILTIKEIDIMMTVVINFDGLNFCRNLGNNLDSGLGMLNELCEYCISVILEAVV